ncbi:MAG: hypothetical protein ACRD9Q_02415, partial [Nitrososphaeraceae archaeon]
MKKSLYLLFGIIIFASFQTALGEQYYYKDHKLIRPPIFCGLEINDPQLPEAGKELLKETEMAIAEWADKLVEYTNNTE